MRSTTLAAELARRGATFAAPGADAGADAASTPARVLHFGDAAREAEQAFARGAVRDQSARARLLIRGKDRVEFVQRMCTNDARNVGPDSGVAAVLTNAKGRIVDVVRIVARGDDLVLLGSDGAAARLRDWLSKFIVMEELSIDDAAGELASLLAFGPHAEAAVASVVGVQLSKKAGGFAVATGTFDGATVTVAGAGEAPFHGLELLVPSDRAGALFSKLADAGLAPIGEAAWNQVRIEAGIPLAGRELTENVNPLEASLIAAVSFTKGCYIGQEVVARLNSYSKVQRQLVGVKFPASVDPAAVNEIFWDLLRVGNATSAVRSPRLDATVALAFIKSDYTKPGTPVYTVRAGERFEGTLCEVPFR